MTPSIIQVASGPGWAMVIVLLVGLAAIVGIFGALLKGMLEKFHLRASEDGQITRASMLAATDTMRDIRESCTTCQQSVLVVIKTVMGEQVERAIVDNRKEHVATRACIHEVVEAEGREEDRTVKELQEINRTLSSLVPQGDSPPVLGVGSQVRESVAATK